MLIYFKTLVNYDIIILYLYNISLLNIFKLLDVFILKVYNLIIPTSLRTLVNIYI